MTTPTLTTDRLLLEPVRLEHAPSLQQHFADWEVIRHLSAQVPWPYPPDGVDTFLRQVLLPNIAAGKAMAWALVPREHAAAVGLLEWRCDPEASDHRVFWIARAWQGRGLMTEAVTAFQDWLFFEHGADRLIVHNASVNEASRRVKEKTGARLLQLVDIPHHEGHSETQQWEVTRQSWAACRGRTL
jgi:ribosomal-protein-alanine N-acetyltransferase